MREHGWLFFCPSNDYTNVWAQNLRSKLKSHGPRSGYLVMVGLVRTDGFGEHLMIIDLADDLTRVERNFVGNSYLSTGLWMMMFQKQVFAIIWQAVQGA
jgi:hypothetical protein